MGGCTDPIDKAKVTKVAGPLVAAGGAAITGAAAYANIKNS